MSERESVLETMAPKLASEGAHWQGTPAGGDLRAKIQGLIGDELLQVEKLIRTAASSHFPDIERLSQSAAATGGKRLRPTLALLAAHACQAAPFSQRQQADLRSISASVELVHAASLVHDDVMDAAQERRHQPTIVGQAGNSAAVLLGDFMFTRAYALAAACRHTYPARQIAAAATQLCEGELRQQSSAQIWSTSKSEYRSILLQKTGALCAVSCRLGGWRVAADRRWLRGLSQFGNALGLAFQIYDDWLDYWGTEQVGKTLGTDLAQRKPTLPLIRLLETASPAQRAELLRWLETPSGEYASDIRSALDASDAAAFTLKIARRCIERGKAKLNCLPPSTAKECLLAVADFSVRRVA